MEDAGKPVQSGQGTQGAEDPQGANQEYEFFVSQNGTAEQKKIEERLATGRKKDTR